MSNNFTVKQADKPFQPVTITIENQVALEVLIELLGGVSGDVLNDVRQVTEDLYGALKPLNTDGQEPKYFTSLIDANPSYDHH